MLTERLLSVGAVQVHRVTPAPGVQLRGFLSQRREEPTWKEAETGFLREGCGRPGVGQALAPEPEAAPAAGAHGRGKEVRTPAGGRPAASARLTGAPTQLTVKLKT